MRQLNYNHLLYFFTVAREGSITKASEVLHLTPQTISGQIKLLEDAVGTPLFERVGRGLALSETGEAVKQYADEIFSLGNELMQWLNTGQTGSHQSLNIGIVNSIPKLVAHSVLHTALELDPPAKLVCHENSLQSLLADLAVHKLDLVLSDRQIPADFSVKAYSHLLGESPISFYGRPQIARQYRKNFPQSLASAPVLMPMNGTALRRSLDSWFQQMDVTPRIVAEFDDSALLKAFGEAGAGIFPAPKVIEQKLMKTYHVSPIGVAEKVFETYYAISIERVLKRPAVKQITNDARERFALLK